MLVDLRPVIGRPPIEIVARDVIIQAGKVDDSSAASDSAAADHAIRMVVDTEWLVPHHSTEFDFEHNWDSVAEMASYLDSRRHRMHVLPSHAEVKRVFDDLAHGAASGIQVRCRWRLKLDSYRRKGGTQN